MTTVETVDSVIEICNDNPSDNSYLSCTEFPIDCVDKQDE